MISKSKRGLILILSSPSGAGKTTLAKKIEDSDSNFKISVSYTTRTPRPNEVDGVDYNFVSVNKFQELSNQNKFLEQAKVFGNYYGTLKEPIEDNLVQGKDYLFDIDWQGTEQVKKIIVEHLGVDEAKVTDEASFIDDLGADSLDTVELVMAFEEEFGSEISDTEAEKILTVGDAIRFIENNPTK